MSDGLKFLTSVIEARSSRELRVIDRELFDEAESRVFDFVRGHFREYGELPALSTIRQELRVTMPPAEEPVDYYKNRLYNRKLYVDVRDKFPELRQAMQQNDMASVVTKISEMHSLTRRNSATEDLRNMDEAGEALLTAYRRRHESPGMTGIPSGWHHFDDQTGGYQGSDLVGWVARMGMGKTYLLLKQAYAAWQAGYYPLVITMEMAIDQLMPRLAAVGTGINPTYIKKGMLSSATHRRMVNFMNDMVGGDRFMMYAGSFNKKLGDLEVLAREVQPDIVFIDGAYLLKPENAHRMSRHERIAEVFDGLAEMRVRLGLPIVFTTQFSRQAGKRGKEGSLENIGFTDAIGMHCTMVLSVREGNTPHQSSRRIVTFLKGREGESGEFQTHYSFSPVNFDQVTAEENAEEAPNLDWMGES